MNFGHQKILSLKIPFVWKKFWPQKWFWIRKLFWSPVYVTWVLWTPNPLNSAKSPWVVYASNFSLLESLKFRSFVFSLQTSFWVWKKMSPNIILGQKKIWSRKKFKSKKIWVRKNFGLKKILGLKKFWDQQNFRSEKNLGLNKIWVQKKFGAEKNFGLKKFWIQKMLLLFFFFFWHGPLTKSTLSLKTKPRVWQ